MRALAFVAVSTLCCCLASGASAQAPECEGQVVGFSADGKVALVRSLVTPGEPGQGARLAIVRLDLASGKVVASHLVLTAKDLDDWQKANPAGSEEQAKAALGKLRGRRWAELEKLLARDGFKVEPAYRALQRSGSETGARFALPGGATLALDCKQNADESRHRCDLVATREKKRAVVVAGIYDEMPSFISMNWIENVYADPAARSVIAVERFAGASEPGSGLRVLELAAIERALR